MLKFTISLCIVLLGSLAHGQVIKNLNVDTPGTLNALLTSNEKKEITTLTLTGTIDARDFKILRDSMNVLSVLELSAVTITAYSGSYGTAGTSIVDYPANAVPDSAFSSCSNLTSVTIPQAVTIIGDYAFYLCYGLKSITIPQSLASFGDLSFFFCKSLTSITIPSTVTYLNDRAFEGCESLTEVDIPSSVTYIGKRTFLACSSLSGTLIIPSSVTHIEGSAFAICNSLASVMIPSSVTYIGKSAFSNCSGLITVESDNQNYSSLDGVLFNKSQTTLIHYPISKSGSYDIPSTVTSIEDGAFFNCSVLTSVLIPPAVTYIGFAAFRACSTLTSVTIPPSVNYIGGYAFEACKLTSLTIPASVNFIGAMAFRGCSGMITVESNNQKYSSLEGVLFNKDQTTLIQCPTSKSESYIIPSTVAIIEINAFDECKNLTSLTIPTSVTTINTYAFLFCSGLASIYAYNTTPIDLSSSSGVFIGVDKTTCTLYVPIGSKSLYQAAKGWLDFENIVEFEATAVHSPISTLPVMIKTINSGLEVSNTGLTALVSLYDMQGRLVFEKTVSPNETINTPALQMGVYIVTISTSECVSSKKVMVK